MEEVPHVYRLRDGAKLAYRILNPTSVTQPLVLVHGLSGIMSDWEPLASGLAKSRPGIQLQHE